MQYSQADRQLANELRALRVPTLEIAEEIGCSTSTVNRWTGYRGHRELFKGTHTLKMDVDDLILKMEKMQEFGMSPEDIAEIVELHPVTVERMLTGPDCWNI